jgi:hypothetical protein
MPKYLSRVGDSLIFNQEDSEFVFYVPEVFFNDNTKQPIAEISGQYVTVIGILLYSIIDKNGKANGPYLFNFPTMIMCKPNRIEKVKGLKLKHLSSVSDGSGEEGSVDENDYRLLHFEKGDEVISNVRVPKLIDNVEMFFKLTMITAKIPNSIAYDKIWEEFLMNIELNGFSYSTHAQILGVLASGIARNPKNVAEPFRYTNMNDMHAYTPISVKKLPNYTSPFTSLTSEGFDEGIMSAVLMKDKDEKDIPYSPLETVLMG